MEDEKYLYDIRYPFLVVVALFKSSAGSVYAVSLALKNPTEATIANIVIKEVLTVVLIFGLLGVFLLTSFRIQLRCHQSRRRCSCGNRVYELRCGGSAFSVPLTLSLSATLLLPLSAFFYAYAPILIISFWSDSIHEFFTARFSRSRIIRRQLVLLPVMQAQGDVTSIALGAANEPTIQDASTAE